MSRLTFHTQKIFPTRSFQKARRSSFRAWTRQKSSSTSNTAAARCSPFSTPSRPSEESASAGLTSRLAGTTKRTESLQAFPELKNRFTFCSRLAGARLTALKEFYTCWLTSKTTSTRRSSCPCSFGTDCAPL